MRAWAPPGRAARRRSEAGRLRERWRRGRAEFCRGHGCFNSAEWGGRRSPEPGTQSQAPDVPHTQAW